MTITKEQLIADLKLVAGAGGLIVTRDFYRNNGKYSERQWSKHFSKFDDFCAAANVNQPTLSSEITGDKWSVFIPSTTLCTADDVVHECKVDLTVWELERFRAKDVSKDGEKKFQISAFFKRRKDVAAIRKEIDALRKLGRDNALPPRTKAAPENTSGNMLEVNIPDAHFGKLAWPEETGFEPYDIKIASAMYMRAVDAVIEKTKHNKYEEVLFVVGNDMLNADDLEGRTTSGTQVTNDARYHKVFDVARTTLIWAVEKLRKIAPVKVIVVSGNHDQLSAWHLGDSLQCYFHKYGDVIVDNQPRLRKYHEFGSVMLMFTHGHKGEKNDYPLMMATEQPEMFGRTKFREAHTGHLHFTKLDEHHGVRVRQLSALCPSDDWHSENGYFGNLRNVEAFTWNKTQGLTDITLYNDNSQEPLITQVTFTK
jgi:hypothetical protein